MGRLEVWDPELEDRATSEFVAIEQRHLQLEERRAQTEAHRVEVDNERNNLLGRFANITEALLQNYLSRARDSDITVQLDNELVCVIP